MMTGGMKKKRAKLKIKMLVGKMKVGLSFFFFWLKNNPLNK